MQSELTLTAVFRPAAGLFTFLENIANKYCCGLAASYAKLKHHKLRENTTFVCIFVFVISLTELFYGIKGFIRMYMLRLIFCRT